MKSLALEMLSCFPCRVAQVQFNFFANTTTSVAMIDNVPVTQAGTRNYVSCTVRNLACKLSLDRLSSHMFFGCTRILYCVPMLNSYQAIYGHVILLIDSPCHVCVKVKLEVSSRV